MITLPPSRRGWRCWTLVWPLTLAASGLLHGASFAQTTTGEHTLFHYLRSDVGLSDDEIRRAGDGAAVVTLLDSPLSREIAVFGVIRIDVPIDYFLDRYEDIETFEKGAGVRQIRKISDPPRAEDFAQMTIPEGDLKAIPKCRVGDCEVKIGEENLRRLQNEIDWNAPDAVTQANEMVREIALNYVRAYQRGGNTELAVYHDKNRPYFVTDEFRGLLENSPYLPIYLPKLHRYLLEYPNLELPRAFDFFYWSENEFGLKPIVRVNHVTIYRPTDDPNGPAVIASKQLYCSHYFHTALELRFLVRTDESEHGRGFYFMSLNRSRSDGLTGITGFFAGRAIRNRTRDAQERFLESTQHELETAFERAQR